MSDIARESAWMALGTIVSRITGFARLMLLVWAIGTSVNADLFNTANTLPNSLYILVAGGVFNVVLVPQLVRAMKHDDNGEAYAQRVITLGLLVLAAATAVLVVAVPLIVRLVFASRLLSPALAEQRADATFLMYLCLPQVFFYGAFVLVGQVLNARGRFGPMMWAPILNNVIACTVLGMYLGVYGARNGSDGFSTAEILLLGIGSTLGIAVQAAALVPYLRRAGFHYRPRFDFRATAANGGSLGHTLRLGTWTLLFIVVNQLAFVVVNRFATGGNLAGAAQGTQGSGSAVYELGFLISQVPHGVITVSLATAILPTLSAAAADGHFDRLRFELGRTVRLALVVLVPLAVAVACLGTALGSALAIGAASGQGAILGGVITAFALAMVTYSGHYLMLRGFYAAEDTRSPFFLQVAIAALNVSLAAVLVRHAEPRHVAMVLALAFGLAYAAGVTASSTLLSRRAGSLLDREMATYLRRLVLACAVEAAVMLAIALPLEHQWPASPPAGLAIGLLAGVPGTVAFLLAAKATRLDEVRYLVTALRNRR